MQICSGSDSFRSSVPSFLVAFLNKDILTLTLGTLPQLLLSTHAHARHRISWCAFYKVFTEKISFSKYIKLC